MMARYCAGTHDVLYGIELRAAETSSLGTRVFGENENRALLKRKFDSVALSLHVLSIP
jgi:hypothetical protein